MAESDMPSKTSLQATLMILTVTLSAVVSPDVGAGDGQSFDSGSVQTTLVELFTSQGCSSCPPAERWLGKLKDDPRLWKEIVPVAFHVDYWDYIGWEDIYADSVYSARQRRYRSESGIRSVYTPGFVVNGQEWRGWFQNRPLPLAEVKSGRLQVTLNEGRFDATYSAWNSDHQGLILNVALLGMGLRVDVTRGENAGRWLSQEFTVLHLDALKSRSGHWAANLPDIEVPGDAQLAIAMWVSTSTSQKPLQAVGGWLAH